MAVTVEFPGGIEATLDEMIWVSDDPILLEYLLLRMESPDWMPNVGEEPDPQRAIAKLAIAELGGKIISADRVEPVLPAVIV